MNRNRRRLISVCLAITLVMFGLGLPTPTRAEVLTNTVVPITILVNIPCVPETVLLTGELHVLIAQEVDSNGGIHIKSHSQPQGISGVGMLTGDKYQGTGVTQEHFNDHAGLPIEDTFVNNFRIIGQGPGNNFLVHTTLHITIDANGVLTADVVNASTDCK
jgi:hypothetical protein